MYICRLCYVYEIYAMKLPQTGIYTEQVQHSHIQPVIIHSVDSGREGKLNTKGG